MSKDSSAVSGWLSRITQYNSKNIDLSLNRVQSIANKLKLTHFNCPVILVGGTNGKGSCVNILAAIYQNAGYAVGISTSPHFHCINERLQINSKEVSDKALLHAFEAIEAARCDIPLTFFEFTTLAFLYILKFQRLDVVILEIGLGGRLDAMNVVDPDISIITSIDLDHIEYLGHDLETIGREKAGIFRTGKPAICGDPNPPKSVIEESMKVGAKLYKLDSHVGPGCIQLNLPTALKAIELLQEKLPVSKDQICINNIRLPGRFDVIDKNIPVILDVAHNPAACTLLSKQITNLRIKGKIFALVSFLKDKDISGCIEPMKNLVDEWHTAQLNCDRAIKIHNLSKKITDISKRECYTHKDIADGLATVLEKAKKNDICLVFGSFFAVAEAREYLL